MQKRFFFTTLRYAIHDLNGTRSSLTNALSRWQHIRILNTWPVHGFVLMLLSGGAALAAPEGHEPLFASTQNAATLSDADRGKTRGTDHI